MKTSLMLAAIAASLTLSAAAHAEELAALKGVPAEAMSRSEMAAVEGRGFLSYYASRGYSNSFNNAIVNFWNSLGFYRPPVNNSYLQAIYDRLSRAYW